MSDIAICVENVSKQFQLGRREPQARLSELPSRWAAATARLFQRGVRKSNEDSSTHALQDVSFEVQRGEVMGIIGANGAGKSTLLKILTRITRPTSGRVRLRGRVGALLEVGTGFHPELTGRENIYLNGAILGMTRAEISRKFDAIVDFSGVEKFLDTAVKHYSSGMQVRLAFAVAAHLEPEILLVDEVLAVGDAMFQKKCLTQIDSVSKAGQTILIISHNMNALSTLCGRVLLLEGGRVSMDGEVSTVIESYLGRQDELRSKHTVLTWQADRRKTPFFTDIHVNGNPLPTDLVVHTRRELTVTISGDCRQRTLRSFGVGINVYSAQGMRLMSYGTQFARPTPINAKGHVGLKCRIAALPLLPGHYFLEVTCMADGSLYDVVERIARLTVQPTADAFPGEVPKYELHGYYIPDATWELA